MDYQEVLFQTETPDFWDTFEGLFGRKREQIWVLSQHITLRKMDRLKSQIGVWETS